MVNEDSKRRYESVSSDCPERARAAAHLGGRPRDGWESLLAVDEDSNFPIDHCAVLSEN